jgi:hypothetical protein
MVTVVTLSRQEMNMDTHCYTNLNLTLCLLTALRSYMLDKI